MHDDLRSGAIQAAVKLPLAQCRVSRRIRTSTLDTEPSAGRARPGFNCIQGGLSGNRPARTRLPPRDQLRHRQGADLPRRLLRSRRPAETTLSVNYWSIRTHDTAAESSTSSTSRARSGWMPRGIGQRWRWRPRREENRSRSPLAIATRAQRAAGGKLIHAAAPGRAEDRLRKRSIPARSWTAVTRKGANRPRLPTCSCGLEQQSIPTSSSSVFITAEIGSWSDTIGPMRSTDRLFEKQQSTIDPAQRKKIVDRIQESFTVRRDDLPRDRLASIAWDVGGGKAGLRRGRRRSGGRLARPVMDSYVFRTARNGFWAADRPREVGVRWRRRWTLAAVIGVISAQDTSLQLVPGGDES